MRAGDLDRVIEIQRATIDVNAVGTPTKTWAPVATMRAKLLQFSADDKEGQRGNTTDTKISFRTRWLDGVTLEHRVVYDGQNFTIRKIVELGRRVGLDIVCEKVGP